MKNLILSLLLLIVAITVKAQSVDTTSVKIKNSYDKIIAENGKVMGVSKFEREKFDTFKIYSDIFDSAYGITGSIKIITEIDFLATYNPDSLNSEEAIKAFKEGGFETKPEKSFVSSLKFPFLSERETRAKIEFFQSSKNISKKSFSQEKPGYDFAIVLFIVFVSLINLIFPRTLFIKNLSKNLKFSVRAFSLFSPILFFLFFMDSLWGLNVIIWINLFAIGFYTFILDFIIKSENLGKIRIFRNFLIVGAISFGLFFIFDSFTLGVVLFVTWATLILGFRVFLIKMVKKEEEKQNKQMKKEFVRSNKFGG